MQNRDRWLSNWVRFASASARAGAKPSKGTFRRPFEPRKNVRVGQTKSVKLESSRGVKKNRKWAKV